MATAKQLPSYLQVGEMCSEFPRHEVSAIRNEWWKGFSFGKKGVKTSQIHVYFLFLHATTIQRGTSHP